MADVTREMSTLAKSAPLIANAAITSARSQAGTAVQELMSSPRQEPSEPSLPPTPREEPPSACHRCLGVCFPFRLPCCVLQDPLHIMIMVSAVIPPVVVISELVTVLSGHKTCEQFLCFPEWIPALCLVPSAWYFFKELRFYDIQLQKKRERMEKELKELEKQWRTAMDDMRSMLEAANKDANDFAQGRFDDKLNYFRNFLDHVRDHEELYMDDQLLMELKTFVLRWLHVFAGREILPANSLVLRPETFSGLTADQELNRARSAQAVCEIGMRRSNHTMEIDTQADYLPPCSYESRQRNMTWLECRRENCRCSREMCGVRFSGDPEGGLIAETRCCCGTMRLLSQDHVMLLLYFFLDAALLITEVWAKRWVQIAMVALNEASVTGLLIYFEVLNEIAVKDRQTKELEERKQRVMERQETFREKYVQMQNMKDRWGYRVLPVLSLMEGVHNTILTEDNRQLKKRLSTGSATSSSTAREDARLAVLISANHALQQLESRLGSMEDWDNGVHNEDARWLGRQLKDKERERWQPQIMLQWLQDGGGEPPPRALTDLGSSRASSSSFISNASSIIG